MDRHVKTKVFLRGWLHSARWWRALDAMEFGATFHVGLRKDGCTPEFAHQIDIAQHIRTLPDLMYPEETMCAAFLHDVREDYRVGDAEIRGPFGPQVADAVERLTKVFRGEKKDPGDYFKAISECPVASVVKGCDRVHNLNSMIGVFTPEKQRAYAQEGEEFFLPMLKAAARRFPRQEAACQNVRLTLRSQIQLVRAALATSTAA